MARARFVAIHRVSEHVVRRFCVFGMQCAEDVSVGTDACSWNPQVAKRCLSLEITMTASTCRHADRPLAFTISVGEAVHPVRAHRIHPVGLVLDGSRGGLRLHDETHVATAATADDFSWGHDVCADREGLMREPSAMRRRQRLRSSRAAFYQPGQ